MTPAIAVEDLAKTFVKRRSIKEIVARPWAKAERVTALDGVSFSVEQGEIFGLLGPNGAGKTTLLKVLSCLIIQSRGRASINGYDTLAQEMRVKRSVGFVTSDERSFYWRLSGRENLHFFARLFNLPPSRVRRRCQELLDGLDLGDKADHAFMTYSSGMKQRMAVARALLHDPPVLYMDEPTRSLDPLAARHLRELIGGQLNRDEGKTILLATHNLAEAEQMCTRIAILHKARVRLMGTLPEVRSWVQARERYVIEVAGLDGRLHLDFPGGRAEVVEPAEQGGGGSETAAEAPRAADARAPSPTLGPAGRATLRAEVEPGGAALTYLLGQVVNRGGVVVSCTRQEPSLQEIFDRTIAEEAGGAAEGRGPAGSRSAAGPADGGRAGPTAGAPLAGGNETAGAPGASRGEASP